MAKYQNVEGRSLLWLLVSCASAALYPSPLPSALPTVLPSTLPSALFPSPLPHATSTIHDESNTMTNLSDSDIAAIESEISANVAPKVKLVDVLTMRTSLSLCGAVCGSFDKDAAIYVYSRGMFPSRGERAVAYALAKVSSSLSEPEGLEASS